MGRSVRRTPHRTGMALHPRRSAAQIRAILLSFGRAVIRGAPFRFLIVCVPIGVIVMTSENPARWTACEQRNPDPYWKVNETNRTADVGDHGLRLGTAQ